MKWYCKECRSDVLEHEYDDHDDFVDQATFYAEKIGNEGLTPLTTTTPDDWFGEFLSSCGLGTYVTFFIPTHNFYAFD